MESGVPEPETDVAVSGTLVEFTAFEGVIAAGKEKSKKEENDADQSDG